MNRVVGMGCGAGVCWPVAPDEWLNVACTEEDGVALVGVQKQGFEQIRQIRHFVEVNLQVKEKNENEK